MFKHLLITFSYRRSYSTTGRVEKFNTIRQSSMISKNKHSMVTFTLFDLLALSENVIFPSKLLYYPTGSFKFMEGPL